MNATHPPHQIVDEGLKDQSGNGTMRKEVRKVFSEKYLGQSTAKLSEKKATGLSYFYKKLRF